MMPMFSRGSSGMMDLIPGFTVLGRGITTRNAGGIRLDLGSRAHCFSPDGIHGGGASIER